MSKRLLFALTMPWPPVMTLGLGLVLGRWTVDVAKTSAQGEGGDPCTALNGDVDGDGRVHMTDAISILGYLFLGEPRELMPVCDRVRSLGLPDTGQQLCHDEAGSPVDCLGDSFGGQDGAYDSGCPLENRFVNNGDGTVTDACTGLMWQGAAGSGRVSWSEALQYCERLTLGGHDDWRLPNIRELSSLVHYGRTSPALPFGFGYSPDIYGYWSSTTNARASDAAIAVTVLDGWYLGGRKTDTSNLQRIGARAVRTDR
jgi:hypothetical protein